MPRLFSCLVIGHLIVLVGVLALGLYAAEVTAARHVALAVFSLLLSCFIQVLTFTYLTVTGKMIAQAVHLGRLGPEPIDEVKRLKRSMARQLALLFATIVVVTATGANLWRGEGGSLWHLAAAAVVFTAHAIAYYREFSLVCANTRLVERTLAAYDARRVDGRASTV